MLAIQTYKGWNYLSLSSMLKAQLMSPLFLNVRCWIVGIVLWICCEINCFCSRVEQIFANAFLPLTLVQYLCQTVNNLKSTVHTTFNKLSLKSNNSPTASCWEQSGHSQSLMEDGGRRQTMTFDLWDSSHVMLQVNNDNPSLLTRWMDSRSWHARLPDCLLSGA